MGRSGAAGWWAKKKEGEELQNGGRPLRRVRTDNRRTEGPQAPTHPEGVGGRLERPRGGDVVFGGGCRSELAACGGGTGLSIAYRVAECAQGVCVMSYECMCDIACGALDGEDQGFCQVQRKTAPARLRRRVVSCRFPVVGWSVTAVGWPSTWLGHTRLGPFGWHWLNYDCFGGLRFRPTDYFPSNDI